MARPPGAVGGATGLRGRLQRLTLRAMTAPVANLFADLPASMPDEVFQVILAAPGIRIERIVSHGHTSPANAGWYDQAEDEWVLLLAGAARVRFEGSAEPVTLGPGDHLHIPAHRRHRVDWTDPNRPTVWLAVHFTNASSGTGPDAAHGDG